VYRTSYGWNNVNGGSILPGFTLKVEKIDDTISQESSESSSPDEEFQINCPECEITFSDRTSRSSGNISSSTHTFRIRSSEPTEPQPDPLRNAILECQISLVIQENNSLRSQLSSFIQENNNLRSQVAALQYQVEV
ncbi:14354_t:CDS:2, partial [Racocetra fulgida]